VVAAAVAAVVGAAAAVLAAASHKALTDNEKTGENFSGFFWPQFTGTSSARYLVVAIIPPGVIIFPGK